VKAVDQARQIKPGLRIVENFRRHPALIGTAA